MQQAGQRIVARELRDVNTMLGVGVELQAMTAETTLQRQRMRDIDDVDVLRPRIERPEFFAGISLNPVGHHVAPPSKIAKTSSCFGAIGVDTSDAAAMPSVRST